jgi:hypothetical protein
MGTFGLRNQPRGPGAVQPDPQTKVDVEAFGRLVVASSRLVVVRAVTSSWGIEDDVATAGWEIKHVEMPWSDMVMTELTLGSLDLAVYNLMRGEEYLEQNAVTSVHFGGIVGHSMGGRSFYVLAHRQGRWANLKLQEMRDCVEDTTVVVGKYGDRCQNLLDVLGISRLSDLEERRIKLVDIPDAPCSVLAGMRDSLLVCGQNRRFEARENLDLFELPGFEYLPETTKEAIRKRSANALFVSDKALGVLGGAPKSLSQRVLANMASRWAANYDGLLEIVAAEGEFDSLGDSARREATATIVYETYRFGAPK